MDKQIVIKIDITDNAAFSENDELMEVLRIVRTAGECVLSYYDLFYEGFPEDSPKNEKGSKICLNDINGNRTGFVNFKFGRGRNGGEYYKLKDNPKNG